MQEMQETIAIETTTEGMGIWIKTFIAVIPVIVTAIIAKLWRRK